MTEARILLGELSKKYTDRRMAEIDKKHDEYLKNVGRDETKGEEEIE